MARWQSGYAAACKAVYSGSIPLLASTSYGIIIGLKNDLAMLVPFKKWDILIDTLKLISRYFLNGPTKSNVLSRC